MDNIILKSGKKVEYDYDLVHGGIIAYPVGKLLTGERHEFKSKLMTERDVVKIVFSNAIIYASRTGKTREFVK